MNNLPYFNYSYTCRNILIKKLTKPKGMYTDIAIVNSKPIGSPFH